MVGIHTSHNFSVNEEFRKQVALLANTPQAKAKRRQTFAVNKHQQGEKILIMGESGVLKKLIVIVLDENHIK